MSVVFGRPNTIRIDSKWGVEWYGNADVSSGKWSTHTIRFRAAENAAWKWTFPAFHTWKQNGLKIVKSKPDDSVSYNNITRLGYRPSPSRVGWMNSIGTCNRSLMMINFQGALNLKLFTFHNAVLYLHLMWQSPFRTMWSHSSPQVNTSASWLKF